jgi:ankyrin repeat protein
MSYVILKWLRLGEGGDDLKTFVKESKGKDIGKDEDGNTILHIAASGEDSELFEVLLDSNRKIIDSENKKNRTPLHIAAKNNRHEIVDILIKGHV